MINTGSEIARAYARTMKLCEASVAPETEDYQLSWEEALDQTGAPAELKPVVLALLESGRADIRSWVERQTEAQLPL